MFIYNSFNPIRFNYNILSFLHAAYPDISSIWPIHVSITPIHTCLGFRGQVKASGPVPGSGFISEWYLWSHTVIPLERDLSVGSGAAGKHWTSIWRHTNTNAQYSVDLKDAVKSQVI